MYTSNLHITNEDEDDAGDGEGGGCDVLPPSPKIYSFLWTGS